MSEGKHIVSCARFPSGKHSIQQGDFAEIGRERLVPCVTQPVTPSCNAVTTLIRNPRFPVN
jgi:hypothetical protein